MTTFKWLITGLVALTLITTRAGPAAAFESDCTFQDEACEPGPQAAQGRWVGEVDEHRRIFALAVQLGGFPASLNEEVTWTSFAGDAALTGAAAGLHTVQPVDMRSATRVVQRITTPAEMAQLPDFGYALWDWAAGFEGCPFPNTDAQVCHKFDSHIGLLNSHHFVPQAQHYYTYYHNLALQRAAACVTLNQQLGVNAARLQMFLRSCEKQALILEGIAFHFLGDAWSTGHMWERWGSPAWEDFPDSSAALVVALISGVIHGARSAFSTLFPSNVDMNDAMCAPSDDVQWRSQTGAFTHGVGDSYLDDLMNNDPYAQQRAILYSCAVSSLAQVYTAAGALEGPQGPSQASYLMSVDPTSDVCFGQRVSNRALRAGAGIDLRVAGQQIHLPLTTKLLSRVRFSANTLLGPGLAELDGTRNVAYRLGAMRVIAQIRYWGKFAPDETNLAAGGLLPLLEVQPNNVYANRTPLSPYIDPELPWDVDNAAVTAGATVEPKAMRGDVLVRQFHQAHALQWCDAFAGAAPRLTLAELKTRVTSLSASLQAGNLSPEQQAQITAARTTACAVCGEFAQRHVRVGSDAANYDVQREPLCHFINGDAAPFVYVPGDVNLSHGAAGLLWCGCS